MTEGNDKDRELEVDCCASAISSDGEIRELENPSDISHNVEVFKDSNAQNPPDGDYPNDESTSPVTDIDPNEISCMTGRESYTIPNEPGAYWVPGNSLEQHQSLPPEAALESADNRFPEVVQMSHGTAAASADSNSIPRFVPQDSLPTNSDERWAQIFLRALQNAPLLHGHLVEVGDDRIMSSTGPTQEKHSKHRYGAFTFFSSWSRIKRYYFVLFSAMMAASIFVYFIFYYHNSANSEVDPNYPSKNTSITFEEIREKIETVSPPESLRNTSTPQFKALRWLNLTLLDQSAAGVMNIFPPDLIERYILALLYFSTGGESKWNDKAGFLSTDHVCNWHKNAMRDIYNVTEVPLGVYCLLDGNDLITSEIYLADNGLDGELPEEIGHLMHLRMLDLSHNRITGTLPDSISSLSALLALSLWDNSMHGSIQDEVGNLCNLRYLNVQLNSFTGTLPSTIGKLSSLEQLYLSHNEFTATLPSSFGQLSNLFWLSAIGNELTGTIPSTFNNMHKLEALHLFKNKLNGTIPVLSNLTKMQYLVISDNLFTGSIPPSLSEVTNLRRMMLHNNMLNGTIPDFLSVFPDLQQLSLAGNNLEGKIPDCIYSLTNLKILVLADNQFNGTISPDLKYLTELIALSLDNNNFHGEIPTEIGFLKNIDSLFLNSNKFSGTLPTEIGKLTNIQLMQIGENSLSGPVPQTFTDLKNLGWFSLQRTDLSGNLNFVCGFTPRTKVILDCDDQGKISCNSRCCACCNYESSDICRIDEVDYAYIEPVSYGEKKYVYMWTDFTSLSIQPYFTKSFTMYGF